MLMHAGICHEPQKKGSRNSLYLVSNQSSGITARKVTGVLLLNKNSVRYCSLRGLSCASHSQFISPQGKSRHSAAYRGAGSTWLKQCFFSSKTLWRKTFLLKSHVITIATWIIADGLAPVPELQGARTALPTPGYRSCPRGRNLFAPMCDELTLWINLMLNGKNWCHLKDHLDLEVAPEMARRQWIQLKVFKGEVP